MANGQGTTQQLTPQQNRSWLDTDPMSLIATLGPYLQFMSQAGAQQTQDLEQLHAQVQAAQQQAQQAGETYQQAAQTPPQPAAPGANFLNQLLANTASVLGQQPEYGRRAFEQGEQAQQELAKNRIQNLNALKDTYEMQARSAEKLGNIEAQAQFRAKIDTVNKNMSQLIKAQTDAAIKAGGIAATGAETRLTEGVRQEGRMDLERLRQEGQMSLVKFKESLSGTITAGSQAKLDQNTITTWNGKKIIDIDLFVGKDRERVMQAASESGVIPMKHDEIKVMKDIQGARANTQKIMDQIGPLLSKTPVERWTVGMRNRFARVFQTDPTLGGFRTWRGSAIRALRAAAGSGGLRLNQAEINLAVQNDIPSEGDTYDTAFQKLVNLTEMLDSAEDPLTTTDWQALTPTGGVRKPTSPRTFGNVMRQSRAAEAGEENPQAEEMWDDSGAEPQVVE